MRNLFLSLLLANLLVLAWQLWVDPLPVGAVGAPAVAESGGLALFPGRSIGAAFPAETTQGADCLRIGPFPDVDAAQQTQAQLARRGVTGELIARDTQRWLGHWVNIVGFGSMAEAGAARQRLVDAGIADAYLMQDGTDPLISLGVFRDRTGATTVAAAARRLGFEATIADRYRPAVEQWLLIRPLPGQRLVLAETGLKDDLIRRAEVAACSVAPDTTPGIGVPQ